MTITELRTCFTIRDYWTTNNNSSSAVIPSVANAASLTMPPTLLKAVLITWLTTMVMMTVFTFVMSLMLSADHAMRKAESVQDAKDAAATDASAFKDSKLANGSQGSMAFSQLVYMMLFSAAPADSKRSSLPASITSIAEMAKQYNLPKPMLAVQAALAQEKADARENNRQKWLRNRARLSASWSYKELRAYVARVKSQVPMSFCS